MPPPQEIRKNNRRAGLRKIWNSKEWKEKKAKFLVGKVCEWCGSTEKLTAHHPYLESYKSDIYIELDLSGCIAVCNKCHFAIHHGLVLCSVCKEHYHGVGADMCKACWLKLHPEIAEAREKKKEDMKNLKKKMRDDSKTRNCHSTYEQRLKIKCNVQRPSKYNCNNCEFLGDYKKIRVASGKKRARSPQ